MLNTIKDFFLGFAEIISSLVDFVINLIQDIVYVVKLCGSFVAKIPAYFSWLPASVLTLIITIFSIVVIYKILGREG